MAGSASSPSLAIRNNTIIQPDTLACIAMFAGTSTVQLIRQHLNGVGNVMTLEYNARKTFDDLKWGIEAQVNNGVV